MIINLREISTTRLRLIVPTLSLSHLKEGHRKLMATISRYEHLMTEEEWADIFRKKNILWNELEMRIRKYRPVNKNVRNAESNDIAMDALQMGHYKRATAEEPITWKKK